MASGDLLSARAESTQELRAGALGDVFSKNHFFCMRQKKRFLKSKEKR